MKKSIFTQCATTLAAVTFLGTGYAAEQSTTSENSSITPRERVVEKLASLGVTDQQKAQIKSVFLENAPALKPLVQQFAQERRALRDLTFVSPVNETAIRTQVAKVAAVGAELAIRKACIADRIRPILTPEQISKLREMSAEFDKQIDAVIQRIGQNAAE